MKYMLDTNICIYVIKRKPPEVIKRFEQLEISSIGISSITLSELVFGTFKSTNPAQNQLAMTRFAAPLEIWPYGDDIAFSYGHIRAYLESRGTPIGALDLLIAAHALSMDLILVTNNEKEFARVPDLKIENWVRQSI